MDITPAPTKQQHLIQSYGGGRFVVQNKEYSSDILIWPTGIAELAKVELNANFSLNIQDHITVLPKLLIVGTGASMRPLPPEFKAALKAQHITCEPMDTGAACRTYNVLVTEDREVAALLLAV